MNEADRNPTNLRRCTVDGCRRPFYARQVCYLHYLDWYREKEPRTRRSKAWPLPARFKIFTG
jgi:hypothetical protein